MGNMVPTLQQERIIFCFLVAAYQSQERLRISCAMCAAIKMANRRNSCLEIWTRIKY